MALFKANNLLMAASRPAALVNPSRTFFKTLFGVFQRDPREGLFVFKMLLNPHLNSNLDYFLFLN